MPDDKVCEPSTNPNHVNLSNSIKNNVYIVLFDIKKEENSKIFSGSDDKVVDDDLLPVYIIYQTCFKTYVALLI